MDPHLIQLAVHGDERGNLVALEGGRDLPFTIERVYYIYGSNGSPRGFHAHRELKQLMICLSGSCQILLDDGTGPADFRLDRPDVGLNVDRMVWHEMHDLSADCVILVLASHAYDEADYIRDVERFRDEVGQGRSQ